MLYQYVAWQPCPFTFFHLGSTSASLLTLSLCAFWLWMFLSAVDSRDRHYLAYEWNFGISRFAFQMIVQHLVTNFTICN